MTAWLVPALAAALISTQPQQEAQRALTISYTIKTRLDDKRGTLTGTEVISCRNGTSDTIKTVSLHLFANAFKNPTTAFGREMERAGRFELALARADERGSIEVTNLACDRSTDFPRLLETEMEIPLAQPLDPGESLRVTLDFTLRIPAPFSELGRKGSHCLLAHWYPQVAAYTPGKGWHADGYHLFAHSPGEFADYDVSVTTRSDLAVAATGEMLTPESEANWLLLPPGFRPAQPDSLKTLRFTAANVADFAMVAGPGWSLLRDSTDNTDINVLVRPPARFGWLDSPALVKDMLKTLSGWYGPLPTGKVTVVDASGLAPQDASYPGLILMATQPIPGTRLFEQALARQIALQWFSCALSPDELREPWLAQGPAAHAEMRYMDGKYGSTSLIDNPLLTWALSGLNSEYYHRASYYLAASNRALYDNPLDCRDALGFSAASQSKVGLLLRAAERETGPVLSNMMFDYVQAGIGHHPGASDFADRFPSVHARITGASPTDTILPTRLRTRRLEVRPLIGLPSFDAYQVFYGPYAWYDDYHGFQLGLWTLGWQFPDAGPVRGAHMWTLSETYSTNIDDWHTGASYQTPLTPISDRLRVKLKGDYSLVSAEARASLIHDFGSVFGRPRFNVEFGYCLLQTTDLRFRKKTAWDSARTADIRANLTHTYETARLKGSQRFFLARGLTQLGGNYEYWKASAEETHTLRFTMKHKVLLRAFAGAIAGNVPNQDQFYLSGGVASNYDEPVSWGYQGISSGQENWHYDADVNCRGYAGQYLHGRYAYGLNCYLQVLPIIQPFFDIGNVGGSLSQSDFLQPRMDAGLRLKLGPLYADFPFWRYHVGNSGHEFAFRWMLGFRLTDLLGN